MNCKKRTSHRKNHGTVIMAVALMPSTGGVILSSAFNLSMQVLRFLTFTPCSFMLSLSASDSYGVELSSMCVCVCVHKCVENSLLLCLSKCLCVSRGRPCACVVLILHVLQMLQNLVQETRFDTSMVKITCVQTVTALQTIRTAITHS